jgi:hypothetical protein
MMPLDKDLLDQIIQDRDYLFTEHASYRAAERAITSGEVEEAILSGEVIEDYPDDKYGPSCLLLGYTANSRVLHVQVSYPPKVKVITVYVPSSEEWDDDWKTRK